MDTYVKTGLIKFQFRHQLNYGAASELPSQGAECAGDQKKFFSMREVLFANAKQLASADPNVVKTLAQGLKLDTVAFNNCLDSQKYLAKVKAQDQARRDAGWRRRPTFDINGQRLEGGLPFEVLAQAIDKALGR